MSQRRPPWSPIAQSGATATPMIGTENARMDSSRALSGTGGDSPCFQNAVIKRPPRRGGRSHACSETNAESRRGILGMTGEARGASSAFAFCLN